MDETARILSLSAFDAAHAADIDPALRALIERRNRSFGGSSYLLYDEPLHFVRAGGVWMYDRSGAPYLDAYNNVPSVGHCHPHVVEAIARQAATLNTNTRYLYDIIYDYAERLLATFPPSLANIAFTCTGSESSDVALRIARRVTGGQGIVVTANAYHGNTTAVAAISPSSGEDVPIGLDVRTVPAPAFGADATPEQTATFGAHVAAAFADLIRHGVKPAAFVADSIFASDGIYPDPPGFLAPAAAAARAAGALYIADEVQPGFARTGAHMWGFARHGVEPDIVILGKPMGNGLPVAGVVARPDLMRQFASGAGYFNTFGGSPVAAAAGLAVLDVLERESLMANADAVGRYLRDGLSRIAAQHSSIAAVRGAGLYLGVEFHEAGRPAPALAQRVVNGMRRARVLIGTAGAGHILKIRPPLCFAQEHADLFLAAFARVLDE
jgi:4-aminobutyrate aminotransferase-like enzyme